MTDPNEPTGADQHERSIPEPEPAPEPEPQPRPKPDPEPREQSRPDIDVLRYDAAGLVPVVVQQHDTGEVLMVAWADQAALRRALEVGEAVFYSRSRQEQWHKGATSGNTQRLLEVRVDCDADVVLYLVDQGAHGVACHTGARSCFHRRLAGAPTGPAAVAPPLAVPEERTT